MRIFLVLAGLLAAGCAVRCDKRLDANCRGPVRSSYRFTPAQEAQIREAWRQDAPMDLACPPFHRAGIGTRPAWHEQPDSLTWCTLYADGKPIAYIWPTDQRVAARAVEEVKP